MADVKTSVTYVVSLTAEEYNLVCKALGGLVVPGSKAAESALRLNLQMLRNRAAQIENLKESADGALKRAQEAGPPPPEEEP